MLKVGDKKPETEDNVRLESIAKQIGLLVYRGKLVRNAVLTFIVGIALFVLTSFFIGVSSFLSIERLNYFIIAAFLLGMVSVFIGTVYMGLEAKQGYKIILYEVKAHE